MKKMLVADYDDTFYKNEEDLNENLKRMKKFKEQGNVFVIATSRSWKSISEEIHKHNIPYDYVCCNTGAGIFDKNGKQIYANYLAKDQKEEVEKILDMFLLTKPNALSITRFGIQEEQEKDSNTIVGYKIKGNEEDLNFLNTLFENSPVTSDFQIIWKKDQGKLFLNNKLNTKDKAIEQLGEVFPISDYNVITVGDDDVDFTMLKRYNGYRMENSSELLTKSIFKKVYSVSELLG